MLTRKFHDIPMKKIHGYRDIKNLSFLKDFILITFPLCGWAFCLHVCKYTMYLQCPQRPEEGGRSPRPGERYL